MVGQDAAAALPVKLLGEVKARTVLDLCAAPGGKMAALAARGATVTALDRSKPRLERLTENLARLGLAAETVAADAYSSYDPGSSNGTGSCSTRPARRPERRGGTRTCST